MLETAKPCPHCGSVSPDRTGRCIHCGFSFGSASITKLFPVKLSLFAIAVALLGGIIGLIGLSHCLVTSTDAYKQAIKLAQSSLEINHLLGDDIKVEAPVLGFATPSNSGRFVVFSARVVG